MTPITWPVPLPALVSADPSKPYNRPYAVGKTITGTLAPVVAAFRGIHVTAWLRETDLETVLQAWQAVHSESEPTP
jgi:hypothetical protein